MRKFGYTATETASIGQFFNELVATPEASAEVSQQLQEEITQDVNNGCNPFDSLEARSCAMIYNTIAPTMRRPPTIEDIGTITETDLQLRTEQTITPRTISDLLFHPRHFVKDQAKLSVMKNSFTGVSAAIEGLTTLGRLYVDSDPYARIPQNRDVVRKNIGRITSYYHGLAYFDQESALTTLYALSQGTDPKSEHRPEQVIPDEPSRQAFVVDNIDGQLHIRPKYPHYAPATSDVRCPATHHRISSHTKEDRTQPALNTFLTVLGDVALNAVFPWYIDLTSTN